MTNTIVIFGCVILTTYAASLLGSMIGVGGGFIIVPILTIVLGFPFKESVALSLLSISVNTLSATMIYADRGLINYKVGILLELLTVIGVILGAHMLYVMKSNLLEIIFGFLLIFVSYKIIRGSKYVVKSEISIRRKAFGGLTSFLAGILSGLLGIGGGLLKVPILISVLSLPTRVAVATSIFMINITSTVGAFIHYISGLINTFYGVGAITGALIGAQVGSRLGLRIEAYYIRVLFSIVLQIFAGLLILRGVGICPL